MTPQPATSDIHKDNIIKTAISYHSGHLMEKTNRSKYQKIASKQQIKLFTDNDFNQQVIDVLEKEGPAVNVIFHDQFCRIINEYDMGVKKNHTIFQKTQ